jgi:hypothetical protein
MASDAKSKASIRFDFTRVLAGQPNSPAQSFIGWSETFWSTRDPASLMQLIRSNYLPARNSLLAPGCGITEVVTANVPANKATNVFYPQGKDAVGNYPATGSGGPGAADSDPEWIALLLRLETQAGKRRQLWLSGLPDNVTNTQGPAGLFISSSTARFENGIDQAYVLSPAFIAWASAMQACNFGIRYITGHGPPKTYICDPIVRVIPISVRKRNRGRPHDLERARRRFA